MNCIQLDKKDYQMLKKNLMIISTMYSSGNRRVYISKIRLMYSENKLTLETIQKDIKYFKKLQVEAMNNVLNANAERLTEVIAILEKYTK